MHSLRKGNRNILLCRRESNWNCLQRESQWNPLQNGMTWLASVEANRIRTIHKNHNGIPPSNGMKMVVFAK